MKKGVSIFVFIFFIAIMIISFPLSIQASTIAPVLFESNHFTKDGYSMIKIDPPVSGIYTEGNVKLTVTFNSDKTTIDWSSNIPITTVFVKGGKNGNVYNYSVSVKEDVHLLAPLNNGNQQPQISHICFYFKEDMHTASSVATSTSILDNKTQPTTPTKVIVKESATITTTPTVEVSQTKVSQNPTTDSKLPNAGESSPLLFVIAGILIVSIGVLTIKFLKY